MNASPTPARLLLRGISHRFALTEVLHQVGLELAAGESLALVGPSGCGKSTLLAIAAGLLLPSEGTVHNPFTRIGQVFQQPRLLPWQRARDNAALGLKARGMARAPRLAVAEALLTRLGLAPEDSDKYPHQLSGGMQSRVALARALALAPELLLLDEPFAALDVGLRLQLYPLLQAELAERNCALLLVTHDLMDALRLAQRVLVLQANPGRISHQIELSVPISQRSDAWVYQQMGQLLADAHLRRAFEMPALGANSEVPA